MVELSPLSLPTFHPVRWRECTAPGIWPNICPRLAGRRSCSASTRSITRSSSIRAWRVGARADRDREGRRFARASYTRLRNRRCRPAILDVLAPISDTTVAGAARWRRVDHRLALLSDAACGRDQAALRCARRARFPRSLGVGVGSRATGDVQGGIGASDSAALEPRALRAADFITSVSDTQNAEMAARYPWLDAERMAAIPIGGDPDDFVALREMAHITRSSRRRARLFSPQLCGHVSASLRCPFSDPVPRFRAPAFDRARARRTYPTQFRWNEQSAKRHSRPIAFVQSPRPRESPMWCARCRSVCPTSALSTGSRARSGLLLIGSDEPHYTASKIYPALMSGRPFVSLFHRASSAHAILAAAGGGRAFAFDSSHELASLEAPLAEALRNLACAPEVFGAADPAAYAHYHANAIARQFGGIFDRLAAERAV